MTTQDTKKKYLHGTQVRGENKRKQILDAAVRIIARAGTGAVTHREVAKDAQVALASTTYYFKSKSDLLFCAFEHLAEQQISELTTGIEEIPRHLTPEFAAGWWASMIADELYKNRDQLLAEYEMHLETARTEALRSVHRRWSDAAFLFFKACMEKMHSPNPDIDAALVLSVIAGIQVGELADPSKKPERDLLGPMFRRLLHALIP